MTTYIVATARGRTPMAAQLALTFAIAFVVLVAVLHGVRADLVPRAHVLSAYALGPTGWLMALAFFALAASFSALLVALWTSLPGWRGALGRTTLAIAAIGAAMGGLFPMDPIGTPPDQASTSAQLHNVAFMLGGPGMLAAITFVNWALGRQARMARCQANAADHRRAGLAGDGRILRRGVDADGRPAGRRPRHRFIESPARRVVGGVGGLPVDERTPMSTLEVRAFSISSEPAFRTQNLGRRLRLPLKPLGEQT